MAEEDELPQSIRDLNEALKALNSTVESTEDRQERFQKRLRDNAQVMEKFAAEVRAGTRTVKSYEQKKAAMDQDAIQRARSLAREQIEAEKEMRTFSSRLSTAAGASVESQKALLIWGNRVKGAGESLSKLAGGAATFAKDMAEGNTKFTSLNPVIDGVVGAMAKMAEAIPYAGAALSGAMRLAAEGAKFMLGQLQSATDAFQEVSRVGGLTADGMTGLMRQFQTSGMTMEGFKRAIAENSADFAAFGGTVGQGAERFSKISQEIVDSGAGDYLRRLGFTADEMGASTARFIGQQTRLGFTQGKTFQELARSSTAYLKELDLISKITGKSREEQQKRLDDMLRESRFLSSLQTMDQTRADQMKLLVQSLDGVDEDLSAAIRDASSGLMDSEMVKRYNTAGIDILGAVDAIKYSGKNYQEVLSDLQRQTRQTIPFQREMAQVLQNNNDIMPAFYKQNRFATMELDKLGAKAEQEGVQTDKLTGSAADAQKSLEQMSRQMSALATTILPNFASVIAKMTDVMNKGLQKMGVPGVIGGQGATAAGGTTGGGATQGGGTAGGGAALAPGGNRMGRAAQARRRAAAGGGTTAGPAPGAAGGGMPAAPTGAAAQGAGIRPTPEMGAGAAALPKIRDMIAQVESRGDYNVVVGGEKYPLTSMTVGEVMDLQKKLISEGRNSAAGKYQIKYSTLADVMGKAGVGRNDKFDQATQDRLADALIMRRGFNQYASNPTPESKARFLANLAQEWAGLPGGPSGDSYYKGVGDNKAGMGWEQALASFQTGGIATGPKSGYAALLHGNEAVVPLPDGKTIPVEMPNLDRNMEQQVSMMGAQLIALEELVRYMRENTSISAKILQVSQN